MVLESLMRKEFAAETIASLDDEVWRRNDNGDPLTLMITDQGLAALGINSTDTAEDRFARTSCDEIGHDYAATHSADGAGIYSSRHEIQDNQGHIWAPHVSSLDTNPGSGQLPQFQPADDTITEKSIPVLHSPNKVVPAQRENHHSVRSSNSSPGVKPGSKQALVVEMIGREGGATIDDLMAATGWLPHTVRAALSSLRKRGIAVTNDRTGSITRYRTETK